MISIGKNNFLSLEEVSAKFNIEVNTLIEVLNEKKIKYTYLGDIPYVLECEFLRLFKSEHENLKTTKKVYPITEKQIMEETVKLLRSKKRITIKELRECLKEVMTLSDEDLIINKNRKDTRFDQKVRNLISHREGNGLLEYCIYENGYLSLKEE